jgi:hypothetical protein
MGHYCCRDWAVGIVIRPPVVISECASPPVILFEVLPARVINCVGEAYVGAVVTDGRRIEQSPNW